MTNTADAQVPPPGESLRGIRENLGLTQQELARRLGYSRAVVANAERGTEISSAYLDRFAEAIPDVADQVIVIKPTAKRRVVRMPRRPTESDFRSAGIVAVYAAQDFAEVEILRCASTASTIDVLAIRGLGITALNESLLRPLLEDVVEPKEIRILFLRPESAHAPRRAQETTEAEATFRKAIELGIERVLELKRETEHAIDLRLYDEQPVWRILRFDDSMFVSTYCPGWEGQNSQMLQLARTADGALFAAFAKIFERLFGDAEPFRAANGGEGE